MNKSKLKNIKLLYLLWYVEIEWLKNKKYKINKWIKSIWMIKKNIEYFSILKNYHRIIVNFNKNKKSIILNWINFLKF